ncbi:hypothetical protein [Shouchella clausii]|nr:hypothetical protein [Shouchella clausii]
MKINETLKVIQEAIALDAEIFKQGDSTFERPDQPQVSSRRCKRNSFSRK